MKVHVYIYGDNNMPSSRLRWINYIDLFRGYGVDFKIYQLKNTADEDIEEADIIVIQKALIYKDQIMKFKKKCKKVLFDLDDAVWLIHSSRKSSRLKNYLRKIKRMYEFYNLKYYDHIICSNQFLADYLKRYNNNIEIIPSSPSDEYKGSDIIMDELNGKFLVGWTGSKENLFYLKEIEENIKKFFIKNEDAYLLIISNEEYKSSDERFNKKIINYKWSLELENYLISRFNIGIMPNSYDEWVLGKAAFKQIYYMKLSIPTIATNWGYQTTFIKDKENGLLVENNDEWNTALEFCYTDKSEAKAIGRMGFETYNQLFEKEVIFNKYLKLFNNLEEKALDR